MRKHLLRRGQKTGRLEGCGRFLCSGVMVVSTEGQRLGGMGGNEEGRESAGQVSPREDTHTLPRKSQRPAGAHLSTPTFRGRLEAEPSCVSMWPGNSCCTWKAPRTGHSPPTGICLIYS